MTNIEALRKEIAQEIQTAFAEVDLPDENQLVTHPNHYEADEVIQAFVGKHWNDITLEIAYWHRLSLPLFTPQAFQAYVAAFIQTALLAPEDTNYNPGEILEFTFYNLVPLENEKSPEMKLIARIELFTPQQKAVIKKFVEYFLQTSPHHAQIYTESVKRFWG